MDWLIAWLIALDPWALVAIIIGLAILAGGLAAAWVWRGVWLAEHKGQQYASRRWHWYVQAERKARVRRARRAQAQGKTPPPVTLEIQKATHDQRAVLTERMEKVRERHGKV